jgi:cytochrome c
MSSNLSAMMKLFLGIGAAVLLAAPVWANKELATQKACLACHTVDKKLVGPSYADVAKKYAGQKDAEAVLVANIKKGGSGKWGPVPMPPQAALTDAEAQTLAAWILGGAK